MAEMLLAELIKKEQLKPDIYKFSVKAPKIVEKSKQRAEDLSGDSGKDGSFHGDDKPCKPFAELWKRRIRYGI